jgi:hypothetical protein
MMPINVVVDAEIWRLRDHLTEQIACVLVDSSVRKELPGNLSRTIPIWVWVLNRIAVLHLYN